MNRFMNKTVFILICFIVMNILVMLMPIHFFFYALSAFVFSVPIILSFFSKTMAKIRIEQIEMNPKHIFTKIKTNKSFRFLWNIIIGLYFGSVLPVMIYLMDLSEYVAMFLLIIIMLFVNKCILVGRAYKKDFSGRSEGGRLVAIGIMEAIIYPILWITLDKRLPATYLFGTIDDLSGFPRLIGNFVDMLNMLVRALSEKSSSIVILFLLVMLANGGILFVGLYKFFDGLLLSKNDVLRCFNQENYEITVTEPADKTIEKISAEEESTKDFLIWEKTK